MSGTGGEVNSEPTPTRADQACHGQLRAYTVVTPLYESGGNRYDEPPDVGCDALLIYARNGRRAKVLAVRAWRRVNAWRYHRRAMPRLTQRALSTVLTCHRSDYIRDAECPFTGLRAIPEPSDRWIETVLDPWLDAQESKPGGDGA